MKSSGYFTRHREAVDLGLLNEGNADARIQYDVTTFLSRLTEVFQAEKAVRDRDDSFLNSLSWRGLPSTDMPLPVVFIDEVHAHPSLNQTDSDFATFLRWALFVTDGQLAHVLLVGRPEQIVRIEDAHAEFHTMRQRMVVNAPSIDQVRSYLQSEAGGALSDELIDRIASNVGGQLKNLRLFAHTIRHVRSDSGNNGSVSEACTMLLEDLIADSRELVLRTWDRLVSEGDTIASYKKALRFWEMAKVIADEGALPRQAMVNQVFGPGKGVSASEIEEYVAAGILTYCSPDNKLGEGKYETRRAHGQLWLSAASPLIRGAFAHLTNPDLDIPLYSAVEYELTKLMLQQRDGQLSKRLIEQSTRRRASAELMKVAPQLGRREGDDIKNLISLLDEESRETVSELRTVQQEYDLLKWKNKWKK